MYTMESPGALMQTNRHGEHGGPVLPRMLSGSPMRTACSVGRFHHRSAGRPPAQTSPPPTSSRWGWSLTIPGLQICMASASSAPEPCSSHEAMQRNQVHGSVAPPRSELDEGRHGRSYGPQTHVLSQAAYCASVGTKRDHVYHRNDSNGNHLLQPHAWSWVHANEQIRGGDQHEHSRLLQKIPPTNSLTRSRALHEDGE